MGFQLFKQERIAYTTKDTAPLSTAGSGNITTVGQNYTTTVADQLVEGSFVVDLDGNECRLVKKVLTSTTGILESAFTGDLSAESLKYVAYDDIKYVYNISVLASAESAVDGVTIASGNGQTHPIPILAAFPQKSLITPMVIDGATGACDVAISKMVEV